MRPAVKKLYQLLPKVSASRATIASRVVNPTHDELCPKVFASRATIASRVVNPTHDELCPKVSASRATIASRVVNPTHDELCPKVFASICVRVVSRMRKSCIVRRDGYGKSPIF